MRLKIRPEKIVERKLRKNLEIKVENSLYLDYLLDVNKINFKNIINLKEVIII